ncbi:MAG: fasciclin domain-containing protein [Cellulosilyticaceae bacterium]
MKKRLAILIGLMMMIMSCQLLACGTGGAEPKDIVDTASGDKRFETLVTALKAADLVDDLKGEGPFTVFAPTNEAFAKLPAGTLETLLKPENKSMLADILTYHVYPGKVLAADAMKLNGKEIKMLNGKPAKIEVKGKDLFIDGAKVITQDIVTKNGVIHVIDAVMLPPER